MSGYQLNCGNLEAADCALRAQIAHIALALKTEREIGAHPELLDPQTFDEQIDKARRRQMARLIVKWMGNDQIDAELQQLLGSLFRRHQVVSGLDLSRTLSGCG